ncbi:MAG: peptide-methionine (R)-S-oxide reductase MsrB [Bacteroidia bacterium]|nr:peptide-methionine (R)-S-oxide reductase MsrB [Bacteroidia bacterium]
MEDKIIKTDEEWRKVLSEEEYRILRQKSTDPAFTNKYYKHKEDGTYVCAGCGNELFASETKYHSGSGWPSFYDAIANDRIKTKLDESLGMKRVELACAKCDGHLGHVFGDGPNPTGLRYCVNSSCLDFKKEE